MKKIVKKKVELYEPTDLVFDLSLTYICPICKTKLKTNFESMEYDVSKIKAVK